MRLRAIKDEEYDRESLHHLLLMKKNDDEKGVAVFILLLLTVINGNLIEFKRQIK